MAARELLKQKGLRVTPQREAIYRLLAASKAHPTAEYVYQEISKFSLQSVSTPSIKPCRLLRKRG